MDLDPDLISLGLGYDMNVACNGQSSLGADYRSLDGLTAACLGSTVTVNTFRATRLF